MAIPVSLNGGVYMRQTDFATVKSHLDSSNLFDFFQNNKEVTNFGMIDFFATKGYMPQQMSRLGSVDRQFLDTHEFKYSYPTAQKEFYVVEDLSATDKPGIGGSTFRVKFNHRKYDNLWVLTPDVQLPISVYVTEDEILRDGDGWIYTLRIQGENADGRFWKKQFLAPGVKYFGKSTLDSEYNQTYSSIPEFSGGEREFMSHVGYGDQQLHYSITREAAKTPVPGSSLRNYDSFLETVQTYQFKPDTLGYNLSMLTPEQKQSFNGDVTAMYKQNFAKYNNAGVLAERQMAKDALLNVWAPKIEMLGVKLLAQMVEMDAYYGSGGTINVDGRTDVKQNLGLFNQYMLGNTSNYNINLLTREFLETIIQSRLQGKMQFSPDVAGPEIVLKTGKGGLSIVNGFLKNLPNAFGQMTSSADYIKGAGGDNRRLHFATPNWTSWIADSGLRFRVDYEPSLDPEQANDIINPIIPVQVGVGGFRLSSYVFIIDDLTANDTALDGSPNVCELMYRPDWQLRQSYTNGKLAYPGSEDANGRWHMTPGNAGFTVNMWLKNKAYWLKDPTKSLVLKPNNPFTGKPIFDYSM